MDIYSLVGSHLGHLHRLRTMDATAEEQYYHSHATPLWPHLRFSIAVVSFAALIIVMTAASLV